MRHGHSNPTGNTASVSGKLLQRDGIPSPKRAEHRFYFPRVSLGVDGCVKIQVLLGLGVFFP